jgi:hypothetical protein
VGEYDLDLDRRRREGEYDLALERREGVYDLLRRRSRLRDLDLVARLEMDELELDDLER